MHNYRFSYDDDDDDTFCYCVSYAGVSYECDVCHQRLQPQVVSKLK